MCQADILAKFERRNHSFTSVSMCIWPNTNIVIVAMYKGQDTIVIQGHRHKLKLIAKMQCGFNFKLNFNSKQWTYSSLEMKLYITFYYWNTKCDYFPTEFFIRLIWVMQFGKLVHFRIYLVLLLKKTVQFFNTWLYQK